MKQERGENEEEEGRENRPPGEGDEKGSCFSGLWPDTEVGTGTGTDEERRGLVLSEARVQPPAPASRTLQEARPAPACGLHG